MGMYVQVHAVKSADAKRMVADPREVEIMLGTFPSRDPTISLEKAWHGLHFLLTGSAGEGDPTLGFVLLGGEPVGEDLGYGQPRLLHPNDVRRVNAALAQISDDQLWNRFDPERMTIEGIYPGIWDEEEAELREEYVGYFHELKNLVAQASTDGMGLLIVLS